MAKYIDVFEIDRQYSKLRAQKYKSDERLTYYQIFHLLRRAIDICPTVDAVGVVRCKDCKHRDPEDHKCDSGMWHMPFATKDTDYCSYGEKKTK